MIHLYIQLSDSSWCILADSFIVEVFPPREGTAFPIAGFAVALSYPALSITSENNSDTMTCWGLPPLHHHQQVLIAVWPAPNPIITSFRGQFWYQLFLSLASLKILPEVKTCIQVVYGGSVPRQKRVGGWERKRRRRERLLATLQMPGA